MLVHVDAVKEFYAKMTVIHLKKKDVVKSSVKGIGIEFDHERLATILGVHWKKLECCEYIEEDHELPYGDWLTMVFDAFGVSLVVKKGEEPKKYDFFEDTFLTMCKLTRENGVWWIGSGENRRRDDIDVPMKLEALRLCMMRFSERNTRFGSVDGAGLLRSRPLGSLARIRKAEFLKFRASLKEKERTDFMMIWRRRKSRMPDF
ncbi:hypothetical protein Dimus_000506 [Dionaea muscipula]